MNGKPRLVKAKYECPSCHHTLKLEFETLPGLGVFRCPKCGFKAELFVKIPKEACKNANPC